MYEPVPDGFVVDTRIYLYCINLDVLIVTKTKLLLKYFKSKTEVWTAQ